MGLLLKLELVPVMVSVFPLAEASTESPPFVTPFTPQPVAPVASSQLPVMVTSPRLAARMPKRTWPIWCPLVGVAGEPAVFVTITLLMNFVEVRISPLLSPVLGKKVALLFEPRGVEFHT